MHFKIYCMKKLFLSLLLIFFGFAVMAQTGSPLKMLNFHKLPNEIADLKALKDECGRDSDLDNNKAALIRVKAQGFSEKTMLEFNPITRPGIEIIHKKYQDGEMWLYVSSNCQSTIVIKYKGEYEFKLPSKLEAKGVYELVLGMETATLVINAVPQTAEIYVDGNKIGTGYGSAAISIGSEHRYKVTCADYIPEEDVVRTDKAEKIERQIELRPNFGYITIKSEPGGAEIYVDDVKVGTTPYLMKKITLGRHTVEVRKYGYESQADMVLIKVDEVNKQFENVKLVEDKSVPTTPVATSGSTNGTSTTTASGNRTFTVNGVSFEMVEVKGGTFTMGCTSEQGGDCDDDEKPTHNVTLSDYYIGKFEVTQELWYAVMGTTVKQQRDKANTSWPMRGEGNNYPMYYISWNECQEFVRKLKQMTGQNFRLPTEAEWEYAARGGNKSRGYKYSGSNSIDNVAVYAVNSYNKGNNHPDYGTHTVGTKTPNELGIYDMSGNVWEWCQDWYGDYSSSSQTNPKGASSGSRCVLRGGSWGNRAGNCRVSIRYYHYPGSGDSSSGFRLVLVP